MKRSLRRILSFFLAAVFTAGISGCRNTPDDETAGSSSIEGRNSITQNSSGIEDTSDSHVFLNYGETISIEDIKMRYNRSEQNSNITMPLYNIAADEAIEIEFAITFGDVVDNFNDIRSTMVTFHTDPNCLPESRIMCFNREENNDMDSPHKITFTPTYGILTNQSEDDDYKRGIGTWGNAPMYYIALWLDPSDETPEKLEKPIVVPFTVKHEVQAPKNVKRVINDGLFGITWDPVEGADEYRIYQRSGEDMSANTAAAGAETAYGIGAVSMMNTVSENLFTGDYSNYESGEVFNQNIGVWGEYYITAMVDGKESGLSAPITTSDVKLPFHMTDEYHSLLWTKPLLVSELPLQADIENTDGSITKRNIIYTLMPEETWSDKDIPEYKYNVEGTLLTYTVRIAVDPNEPNPVYPERIGDYSPAGASDPESNIEKIPDNSVETIVEAEGADIDKDEPIINQQMDNTQKHVEDGDKKIVPVPATADVIIADSAAEEWFALNFISGSTEIPLNAFPELLNPFTLEDTIYKVYCQNPYIIGIYAFALDYENVSLMVEYVYSDDEIAQKQSELKLKAESIISEIITDNMSDEEKRNAIYNYLEENCSYDYDALEDAEVNGYEKTSDSTYEDSFNAYGIIVNNVGVCQSYAYAYSLLCAMSGVECKVITGYLNGNLPHAWNAVEIDGSWYYVDATNNGETTGIPYFLYNSDSQTAEKTGYSQDYLFDLDSRVDRYYSDDTDYEYYYSINMAAANIDEYGSILDKVLKENHGIICIRYTDDSFDEEAFIKATGEIYYKNGMEDRLDNLSYILFSGYIVLIEE